MVLVLILLPVLLILASLVVNTVYMELVRTETQVAVDAASRAAGRRFAMTGSQDQALAVARTVVARNPVLGEPIPIEDRDLDFGIAERRNMASQYEFSVGGAHPNSVRLVTRSLSMGLNRTIEPLFPVFGANMQFRPLRSAISTQIELDIALVLDRSGSMAYASDEPAVYPPAPRSAPPGWAFGQPVPPNARWLDTIRATDAFFGKLSQSPQQEYLALVTYNNVARTDLALDDDYPLITSRLNELSQTFDAGGTNIGGGILQGLNALGGPAARPWANKVIVLMTDGIHNIGTSPLSAADVARAQNVPIFTITFSNEANQTTMRSVASRTRGAHFHAVDVNQLVSVFEEIARRLPTLLTR
jgi:hypothetical protein